MRICFYIQQFLVKSMAKLLLALTLKEIELVLFVALCRVLVGFFFTDFFSIDCNLSAFPHITQPSKP